MNEFDTTRSHLSDHLCPSVNFILSVVVVVGDAIDLSIATDDEKMIVSCFYVLSIMNL